MKVRNEYMTAISGRLYEKIPKAVLAAIAVSHIVNHEVPFDEVDEAILEEWRILHAQGIVPQKPPSM